ncbi:MAG: F0F1 ATP synthase subunit epsilon [Anaerolineales bacterium]|nr:F0F1 ATP synthase subunit epsilon [Anaerolineales bacterium]
MSPIRCEIVTQERVVYDQSVDMVIAPGSEGELGILPNHVPLLTALHAGELRIKREGEEESFAISGGFMEVQPDHVTVLASTAEHADEIDIERANAARERAKRLIEEGLPPDPDQYKSIEAALRRSQVRLSVARKKRRRATPGAMLGED